MTPAEAAQVLRDLRWNRLPPHAWPDGIIRTNLLGGYSADQLQAIAMWMREPSILKEEK